MGLLSPPPRCHFTCARMEGKPRRGCAERHEWKTPGRGSFGLLRELGPRPPKLDFRARANFDKTAERNLPPARQPAIPVRLQ
eukprot:8722376-Alexandrium_andersonii.AAC.1